MRVLELRALVESHRYNVDPRLVAEALLHRFERIERPGVSRPASARSPSAAPAPFGR